MRFKIPRRKTKCCVKRASDKGIQTKSDQRDQMTSTLSVAHCSTVSDCPTEVHELPKDVTRMHEMPETVNKCEHTIKAQKQFTHLPADRQAALDVRLSKEDAPKCDECAILEDIVANRCEKCLFAQELASQRSKSCEPKSQPASRRSSLTKGRAPLLPSALPLPRTETEAELLVCSPVVRPQQQNVEQHAHTDDKTDVGKKEQVVKSLPGLIARCSSVEIFKRDKIRSQFAGSNVYVIQPTFKQTVRPLTYQATKGVQCKKIKKGSSGRKRSSSYCRKDASNKNSQLRDCQEDFLELDSGSGSANKFSDSESSSNQEEKPQTKQKLRSASQLSPRTRCVLIQCNIPQKRSRSKTSKPKLRTRSKSVSPTKMKSHEYDLPKASFSELCLGSSASELSDESKEILPFPSKGGSVESDTEIIIEEKIYVKCPTDSIRKKKITTGNKSILLRKSLASDIRALLCEEKLSPRKKSSEQLCSKNLDNRTAPSDKPSEDNMCLNPMNSSPDKKKNVCSRNLNFACKNPLPDEKSAFSQSSSVSSGKKSCLSFGRSEHSDSGSSQDDGCDCSDDKPLVSDHSCVFDEKYVCFDETSIASHKQAAKNHDAFESDALQQSESDFCSTFRGKNDKRGTSSWESKAPVRSCSLAFREKNGNKKSSNLCESRAPDQLETNFCTAVCEDNGNKRRSCSHEYRTPESGRDFRSFHQKIDNERHLSFESEAPEQSESDYCAAFQKNRDSNKDWCLAVTDSDDFHSCSEVDSNALRLCATRDPRITKKSYNDICEEIDIETCREMTRGASQGRTRTCSDSHTSVLFKIIGMSRISCIFMTLIILIILFSVVLLAWRITKNKE